MRDTTTNQSITNFQKFGKGRQRAIFKIIVITIPYLLINLNKGAQVPPKVKRLDEKSWNHNRGEKGISQTDKNTTKI